MEFPDAVLMSGTAERSCDRLTASGTVGPKRGLSPLVCLCSVLLLGCAEVGTVPEASTVAANGEPRPDGAEPIGPAPTDSPEPAPRSAAVTHAFDSDCMAAPTPTRGHDADPSRRVVRVSTEEELQSAIGELRDDTVIVLAPGDYALSRTLRIGRDNVTLQGDGERCTDVVLRGKGMDDPAGRDIVPHGIWTDAGNLSVQNLTIRDVWHHGIAINAGARSPSVYNVRLVDTGEQMLKVSSPGSAPSTDDGRVEYSVFEYTDAPSRLDRGGGTGYTNGVDVHGGDGWRIRRNRFENFHTADDMRHLWNPAVLMWNGASDTLVEANVFIDVDRAIAFGLADRPLDHQGGVIRNNMIVMSENLYSDQRRAGSDAAIIVWSSPRTEVLHNTIVTRGNLDNAVQLRYDSADARIANNLMDVPVRDRGDNRYEDTGNVLHQGIDIFRDVGRGDLHLVRVVDGIVGAGAVLDSAPRDFDGEDRRDDSVSDIGADEFGPSGGS